MKTKQPQRGDEYRTWQPVKTSTEQTADEFDNRKSRDRDWLNPIAMSSLKHAVEKKRKKVILNGQDFAIEYGYVIKLPITGNRPCVTVSRSDGSMVPFGYIALDTLKNFVFEKK